MKEQLKCPSTAERTNGTRGDLKGIVGHPRYLTGKLETVLSEASWYLRV